jgi:RimJ/RimL family protein N-acetyltransferase
VTPVFPIRDVSAVSGRQLKIRRDPRPGLVVAQVGHVQDWQSRLPLLPGAHVAVREVASRDAPTLFDLLSDPAVTQHLSAPPPTLDAFAGFIAWAQRERAEGRSVCFGIVPHGLQDAVGIVQVRALEPSFLTAEWGFAIGMSFWSTGAFAEAADLVARFSFETLGVHRLEARAAKENGRGNGALQRMGASPEAELARSFKRENRYGPQLLWSLSAEDWQQCRLGAGRFSPDDATERIARAIDGVKEQLGSERREGLDPPPLYPFFVSDPRRKQ